MTFVYIDTETTGLQPEQCSIFQLAGMIESNGVKEEFNFQIKPYRGESISEHAKTKTNITDEELSTYPDQKGVFDAFIFLLNKYINKNDFTDRAFFIAYNASFDMDFIRSWFLFNGNPDFNKYFYFPAIDVMYLASFALVGERKRLRNFQLSTVYKYLTGKTLDNAHNAIADIKATKELLNLLTVRLRSGS